MGAESPYEQDTPDGVWARGCSGAGTIKKVAPSGVFAEGFRQGSSYVEEEWEGQGAKARAPFQCGIEIFHWPLIWRAVMGIGAASGTT